MSLFDLPDECNLTLPRRCPRHPMYTEIYCHSCEENYKDIIKDLFAHLCNTCGHTLVAHQGHTYLQGTIIRTPCSQDCGCLEFTQIQD